MSDEQIALARRAVACRGWRWMSGMRWIVSRVAPHDVLHSGTGRIVDGRRRAPDGPWLPDFQDPATLGCLLALVREALKAPTTHVLLSFGAWYIEREVQDGSGDSEWLHVDGVWGCGSAAIINASTEAEALVAALEAAP